MTEQTFSFGSQREGPSRYLAALREHWLLILTLVVVSVGTAAIYSLTAPKRYQAEADLIVQPISPGDPTFVGLGLLQDSNALTNGTLTAARLVETPQVAEGVRTSYGLHGTRGALLDSITVKPLSQSNILAIVATAGSGERAAAIANAFAVEVVRQRTQEFQRELVGEITRIRQRVNAMPASERTTSSGADLQSRLSTLESLVGSKDPTLRVVSAAVPPESPSWPRPKLSIIVALLVALLLGAGAALALELFNPRINREDELLLAHRLPILTRVPRLRNTAASRYLTRRGKLPPHAWEAYRTLRASLTGAGPDGGFPRSILVTSAIPGEGKTMTSVNLAITLAHAGERVILVDADLRRPMVATVFGATARSNGLGLMLTGKATAERALLPAPGHPGLQLLLSSPEHAHLVDLLQRHRIETVFNQLEEYADVIVVDSPPLTEVGDALNLADVVDTIIVSVRLGRSRRDKLEQLRRSLAQRGVSPAGFVVTTRRATRRQPYGYSYQGVEMRRTTSIDDIDEPHTPALDIQPGD